MATQSPCRIEFTPAGGDAIVLVDAGGWLAELPVFDAGQRMFEKDGVEAADAYFKPLGGATVDIRFAVEIDETGQAGMLEGFLEDLLTGGKLEGVLTISGDEEAATYDPAVIAAERPGLPQGVVDPTRVRAFTIQAALPVIAAI